MKHVQTTVLEICFSHMYILFWVLQILEELISSLDKFSKDKEVNVVSITSSNSIFCSGLDYSYLVANKEDLRKEKAKRLAKKVK